MAGMTGTSSISPIITTGFLNTVNDALPFNNVGAISGSIVPQYPGAPGWKGPWSEDDALKLTDLSVRTGATTNGVTALNPPNASAAGVPLLGGLYMYVKTSASALAVNMCVGRLAFWDLSVAADAYQVYQPASTDNISAPLIAGVFLNPNAAQAAFGKVTSAVITPGNYCWIQVSGRAILQLRTTGGVASTTPFLVWSRSATAGELGTVDNITAASTFGGGSAATNAAITDFVGVAERGNAGATAIPAAGSYVVASLGFLGGQFKRQ